MFEQHWFLTINKNFSTPMLLPARPVSVPHASSPELCMKTHPGLWHCPQEHPPCRGGRGGPNVVPFLVTVLRMCCRLGPRPRLWPEPRSRASSLPFAGRTVWHVCALQQEQAPVGCPALQPRSHLLQGHPPARQPAAPPLAWPKLTLSSGPCRTSSRRWATRWTWPPTC